MVNFDKLLESQDQPNIIKPTEIFRSLPKPEGINDLYASQDEVLKAWFERRKEKDIVIKLHTGGGKTLVALLIAQSILNEKEKPVIYLSSTNQLVEQTLEKAKLYNIPAVSLKNSSDLPDEFLSARKVLICNYQTLFNGRSRFGIRNGSKPTISVGGIIIDDAHIAFSTIRQQFTINIKRDEDANSYDYLTNMFRYDFQTLGKSGTFDDIVSGLDYGILEVPYWSWQEKSAQIQEFLRNQSDFSSFVWPLIRDHFDYCHCLISNKSLVITPIFPLVNLIPTFTDCSHRIFMSATISDDSSIIRTFDADTESVAKPIFSNSLAGVSERMILAPEFMHNIDENLEIFHNMAKWMAKENKQGTVILTPSDNTAKAWEDVGIFADSTEKVSTYVKELQSGTSHGPFIFSNRYDGIDLPGSACRLLIISGLPYGNSEYDQHRANTFMGSSELSSNLAQRIEQGMGRGGRGAGDYCIVILIGKDIAAWVGRNFEFLTKTTYAQFKMGLEISDKITSKNELHKTIISCLNRDQSWINYHAKRLASLTISDEQEKKSLTQAGTERKAFKLMCDGYYENAISKLEKYWDTNTELELKNRGWLKQLAARAAYYWGKNDLSQQLQQQAYADNYSLLRPKTAPIYVPLTRPGKQAEAIVTQIAKYKDLRKGYIAWFNQEVSHLVKEASSNQFEEGLAHLGYMLGFRTERPEKIYSKGPDVLWLLNNNLGLVIEAKNRKNTKNSLTKGQHGQLLSSGEWFKQEYPNYSYVRISVHPNNNSTKSAITGDSKALIPEKLNQLISDARKLLLELCESKLPDDELLILCEKLLDKSLLKPQSLVEEYLVSFITVEE